MHNKNQIGSFVLGKFAGKVDFLHTIAALFLSLLAFTIPAYSLDTGALPTGYQSVSGNIQFNQSGNTLDVTTAANQSIANYNTFNVGSNATVNFNLPDSNSVILNRVTGGSASEIMGRINSNGQVFLANPSGILFGSSAQVNVGSLLTSTLNIKDSDFLAGQYIFNQLSQPASIVNQGNITVAPGGYVTMLGGAIRNDGTINALEGKVRLAVGDSIKVNIDSGVNIEVTIDQSLQNKVDNVQNAILNTGNIITDGGSTKAQVKLANALYEKAVNNQGLIQANNINNKDGVIELIASSDTALGGDISNSGKLLSNGGNIQVVGNDISFSGGNSVEGLKSRDAAIFSSGSINLGSAVNASNLSLRAGNGIDASASITSRNTSILSKDSVNLSNTENDLLKISANITGKGSSLNIVEKSNIQVDGVNSIEGITTNDGDVSISAGNNIVLWRPINVGSGTINLSAGDNIQQNAGMLVANTLSLGTIRGNASGFINGAIFTDINNLSMNSKAEQGSFKVLNVKDKSVNVLDSQTGNQGLIDVEVQGSGTINVLGSLDAGQVNLVSATNTRNTIHSNAPVNSIPFSDGQFLSALEQEITDQLNGGQTSGSQSGSSTNINDAVLRQIIEEFKNNAKTKTWEEYNAEMISKGYKVDVEFTHQFVAQLADGRTANVTVNGSAKEMYENFRQQSLDAEKSAAQQRIKQQTDTINWTNSIAQEEINRRNEWNDFTSFEKQQMNLDTATNVANQIVGRNQTERNNVIEGEKRKLEEAKKKAEYDLWWNSLTPEQKTEYIAAQNAEKIRQQQEEAARQQEEAARKQKELEQYMNQYNLDWKAEFNDKMQLRLLKQIHLLSPQLLLHHQPFHSPHQFQQFQ